jgi:hypothetical protein
MAVNDHEFDQYRRFYSRSGPYYSSQCDEKCKQVN